MKPVFSRPHILAAAAESVALGRRVVFGGPSVQDRSHIGVIFENPLSQQRAWQQECPKKFHFNLTIFPFDFTSSLLRAITVYLYFPFALAVLSMYRISGSGFSGVSWYPIDWKSGLPYFPTGFSGHCATSRPSRRMRNALIPLSGSDSASHE